MRFLFNDNEGVDQSRCAATRNTTRLCFFSLRIIMITMLIIVLMISISVNYYYYYYFHDNNYSSSLKAHPNNHVNDNNNNIASSYLLNDNNIDNNDDVLAEDTKQYLLDYDSCRNNTILPDYWCFDQDQYPRYVGRDNWPPRSIQHYTHQGYEKCLAGKNIVFIGDSRVRYQFMHLAYFLVSKQFMRCQDYNASSVNPSCYLIEIGTDWNTWYQQSSAMIASEQQESLCDCYRPSPYIPEETYENRFIKRHTKYGEINLVHLQNVQDKIIMDKEYVPFSPFHTSSPKRCKTGECGAVNKTIAFQGNTNETLWSILPKLNTTHAFVSLGWEHLINFEKVSEFSCLLRKFERHHPEIKVFLISHPPNFDNIENPAVVFDATKLECDCNVLDRTIINTRVPRHWYWDKVHVLGILNEEYNHQLLEKICPFRICG